MNQRHPQRAGTHHTAAVKNRHRERYPRAKGLRVGVGFFYKAVYGVHTHTQSHRSTASAAGPGGTDARGARAVELDGGSVTVCHINESPPRGL